MFSLCRAQCPPWIQTSTNKNGFGYCWQFSMSYFKLDFNFFNYVFLLPMDLTYVISLMLFFYYYFPNFPLSLLKLLWLTFIEDFATFKAYSTSLVFITFFDSSFFSSSQPSLNSTSRPNDWRVAAANVSSNFYTFFCFLTITLVIFKPQHLKHTEGQTGQTLSPVLLWTLRFPAAVCKQSSAG